MSSNTNNNMTIPENDVVPVSVVDTSLSLRTSSKKTGSNNSFRRGGGMQKAKSYRSVRNIIKMKDKSGETTTHRFDFDDDDDDDDVSHSNDTADSTTVSGGLDSLEDIDRTTRWTKIGVLVLIMGGLYASSLYLYLSINNAKEEQADLFRHDASAMANEIEMAWKDYERSALWIHESCRDWRTEEFGRDEFEILYNYLISGDIDFYAAQWVPNVTHAERPAVEKEGAVGWGDVEGIDYQGIVGQEPDPDNLGKLHVVPRSQQPFYFPVHFAEPKDKFTNAAHYDLFSSPWERPYVQRALETLKPSLTPRGQILGQTEDYSVVLYHPGTPLPSKFNVTIRDLASLVVNIRSLLMRAARYQSQSLAVYLYDSTLHDMNAAVAPEFMGGIQIDGTTTTTTTDDNNNNNRDQQMQQEFIALNETEIDSLEEAYLFYEREIDVAGRQWRVVVVPVDDTYKPQIIVNIISGILIIGAAFVLSMWMYSNLLKAIEKHRVMTQAAAEAAIVRNMFPKHVRERMVQDARASTISRDRANAANANANGATGGGGGSADDVNGSSTNKPICLMKDDLTGQLLTSERLFGSRPIADLHPYTTVMFADLDGFTAWSSQRDPTQVFTLLEILFHSFDSIAKRRRVYKVETSGDIYVAATGLPDPRSDHAIVMARFAMNCCRQMHKICKALEKTLGPDTSDLGIRIGLHSGQVVGGVLRGDKGRFQLFGDTVHMAAKMEKTGARNRIHVSQETAEELKKCGRGHWVVAREDKVAVLGKGAVQTFFLEAEKDPLAETTRSVRDSAMDDTSKEEEAKFKRLIEWNVEVLSGLLKKIVSRRQANGNMTTRSRRQLIPEHLTLSTIRDKGDTVLDEVAEIINLPAFDEDTFRSQVDPSSIVLDPEVVEELTLLVTKIASMYRENPFHNFEHASHVTMSVVKMMGRICNPNEIAAKKRKGVFDSHQFELECHDHTFGITSDPLTQFACAFSALIHDLDHTGVSNMILIKEEHPLTFKYNNKSVAEQNSVDLSWQLLMAPMHDKLRACICATQEEFSRFRSLVVNSVMATDIMDKELQSARKQRWNKAFSEPDVKEQYASEEDEQAAINRKATIVIEHLIQASDISHTMQHWHVYVKWNEKLFQELYKAFKEGRMEKDPSVGWHQGELGFFDFYIIPLAKKLFTCGVFGVSSDEFLNYALTNRKEWEAKGADMVKQYLINYEEQFEKPPAINTISIVKDSVVEVSINEDEPHSTMTTASVSCDSEELPDLEDPSGELVLPDLKPIAEYQTESSSSPPIEDVFLDEIPDESQRVDSLPINASHPEEDDTSMGENSYLTAASSL